MKTKQATTKIIDGIIYATAFSGIVASSLIVPGATPLAKPLLKHMDHRQKEREIKRVLYYMKHQSLIDYKILPSGEYKVKLRTKGLNRARKIQFDQMTIPAPDKWDKRWRVVIFDVPEKHKQLRDKLSAKLRKLEFYQLQKSVWAHPFPCLAEIELIKETYGLGKFITLMTVESITQEFELREHFQSLIKR
ncbi:MAG: hypothetical protein WDZ81_00740 [Candidatus Saccharimonadales bacterium]